MLCFMFVFYNVLQDCITYPCSLMIVPLTPFICVTSFSVFVLSCVCQLCNKEYMMMMIESENKLTLEQFPV